jgi:F-box/leucine-rich repeat protein 2/20
MIRIAARCPNVDCLTLSSYTKINITVSSIICIAEGCHNMEDLYLAHCCNITDLSIVRIADRCSSIYILDLSFCVCITNISIIRIAQGCPYLEVLYLRGCKKITDDSLIAISEISSNIQTLDLILCDLITDDGIIRLSEIPQMQSLELDSENVTDISMARIAQGCPDIRLFGLSGCHHITYAILLRIAVGCSKL